MSLIKEIRQKGQLRVRGPVDSVSPLFVLEVQEEGFGPHMLRYHVMASSEQVQPATLFTGPNNSFLYG